MHDQNFKNLILDYPIQSLQFFAAEEVTDDLQQAKIIPFRQELLKNRLGDRFHALDTPLLIEWPDGRREAIVFLFEEETQTRKFSIYRLAHYCLELSELAKMERIVPVVIFLDQGRRKAELHLGGDRHTYLSFRYLACELKNLRAEDYTASDNIVARLNLPNMRYDKDRKLDIYHAAHTGLAQLESDPEKQLKYLDFVDLYGGLSEQEIEYYSQTYLSESEEEANMGLKQYLIQKGEAIGEARGEARGEIKGEAQTLHKQLRLKFKDIPDWVTQKINQADKAQLDQWVERILFVNSLDELFKP